MWNGLWACTAVFFAVTLFIPPIGALSWHIGAVDVPRDGRRMHKKPIPRCGGIVIMLSVVIGCAVFCDGGRFLMRALIGAGFLTLVGLLDDIVSIAPLFKLIAHLLAAILACGVSLRPVTLAAILWVVLLTNAHNFIDGIDGLFAGCATVESVGLAIMLYMVGQEVLVLPTFLVGSACLAFRRYNRHPARIFAGDCGSATVGYLLGVLALPLFYEMRWEAGWLSPIFLFIYPLTDLVTSVVRRLLRGKSPFSADRAHLHHRICAIGVGQSACGKILILLSVVFGTVGISLCTGEYLFAASLACLIATAFLVEIRTLLYRS
ncbi:MAG: undecaprenyl/decaprenyl-phosphate alpha-N-acetylglucosaminyl 1-phosphate transferase [Clostridia bacterium]|nr:undecaprenyl/decaprenyl-phosphate alpha-N-acetylglucosaminyl 1-phosphate transferase [Clostridia bacterium]